LQDAGEAASSQLRARWDATAERLVIEASGDEGVKRFELDDAVGELALAAAARGTSNELAVTDPWVWDYADTAATANTGPTALVMGTAAGGSTPGAAQPQVLLAPTLSPAAGAYPISAFPLSVTLTNPNPPGTSRLRQRPDVAYDGQPIFVEVDDEVSGYFAQSIDPTRWLDSVNVAGVYSAGKIELVATVTLPQASLTYLEAGGAMTNSTIPPPPTATLTVNASEIPPALRGGAFYQMQWTTDGSDPLTSATRTTSPGAWDGASEVAIPLPLANFSAAGLTVRGVAVAVDTTTFETSTVKEGTVGITKLTLWRPLINPDSGPRPANALVTLAPATNKSYPAGIAFYYLTNGLEPAVADGVATTGTLYSVAFQTGSTNGSGIVKARVLAPATLKDWFEPSEVSTAVYTIGAGAIGALVGDAQINGTYIGSLILSSTRDFNFNSGARIRAGNLFVRGTPDVQTGNGGVIEGRQFLSDGSEVLPNVDTRKVVDLNGDVNPSNYVIRLNSGSIIEGKIFRRVNVFVPPPVPAPPGPSNGSSVNLGSQPANPLNPNAGGNVNLNGGAGNVTLLPGNWGQLNTAGGTSFVIGTVGATTPSVYNFQRLNLNSNSQLKIVGPVILTLANGVTVNSSVMGNVAHPEWLNLRIASGDFTVNSGASAYADLTAPDSRVNLNGTFTGSVVARSLSINGNGVAVTQATITEQDE
jgi:hypothetical protein